MDKVLLIDKPTTWSSFDVVAKIRSILRTKTGLKAKVGHAGTLDPFATGLLIVLTGKRTKEQDKFMKLDKVYEANLKLGAVSTTGDPEGDIIEKTEVSAPTISEVETSLKGLTGEIFQTPPIFSAIKIGGQRAYKLARKGQDVKMEPRLVKIYQIELINYSWPCLYIRVACSSGTYIRALAEQIGEALGTGAYLTALRRTKIGEFDIKNAKTIEDAAKTL